MDNDIDKSLPITLASISIILILIFILIIMLYFAVFNQPNMHTISINNNCTKNVIVRFGALTSSGVVGFLPDNLLTPKQTYQYKATPGSILLIQGYHEGDISPGITGDFISPNISMFFPLASTNPLTSVKLILAGVGFGGPSQITDGNHIINNLTVSDSNIDKYGVSLQGGYNIPITIKSTGNNNRDVSDEFSCLGPEWNHTIEATGTNACPSSLIYPGNILTPDLPPVYLACSTPCTAIGGTAYCCTETDACDNLCESKWPVPEYYDVFFDACPDCLITNCDELNYTCNSNNGLTQYVITFCPQLQ